ncbi:MAG: IMP dehydrogenase [Deltaproteobacteria bacterium]|nr:IMP dehydrogenase [Deltaproteobacteria bacterium]
MPHSLNEALSFDDVLLVPRYSEILPTEVNCESRLAGEIRLKIPIISAAMDKVTEARTAIAMARAGGVGVIHRNLSVEKQAQEVERVKKSESGMIVDPVTLRPDQTVADALQLKKKFGISGLPITRDGKLVGIVTNRDLRFEESLGRSIHEVMIPFERLVTARETIGMEEAMRLMHKHRIEKLPIVDGDRNLRGLITIKDIEKTISNPLAIRDSKRRLCVGGAIGTGKDAKARLEALAEVGVDFVAVDTAHGDSSNVIEIVRYAKQKYKNFLVIAGNVATAEGADHLFNAGADAIKVGIGCGSICTTRVIAGVGVPQFTAIRNCAAVAKKYGRPLIADGGVKYSGDVVKALAAGADTVMAGSLFAGTEEAPGELVFYQGRTYKAYRGMGSIEAMKEGSRDRYGQGALESDELVPEGIEGMVPYRGHLANVLYQLVGGLKAGMGYLGCHNLTELRERAEFVKITAQGLKESHVHDVYITKEAPNYRPNI